MERFAARRLDPHHAVAATLCKGICASAAHARPSAIHRTCKARAQAPDDRHWRATALRAQGRMIPHPVRHTPESKASAAQLGAAARRLKASSAGGASIKPPTSPRCLVPGFDGSKQGLIGLTLTSLICR
jgi:hypothetical protein